VYKIAVCDDEKQVREGIGNMLERYAAENGRAFQCFSFDSAAALLRDYRADFDILFLDISMRGLNGMEAAREIRRSDARVCIIFVTSMQQYAVQGYRVHAYGFIVKPVNYQELSMELDGALHTIDSARMRESAVTLRSGTQVDRLTACDILYCEVHNHTVTIHLYTGQRVYRYSMKEMESLLRPYGFARPHSAYLVNCAAIVQILGSQLVLANGERIPIAQQKRKEFMARLAGYVG